MDMVIQRFDVFLVDLNPTVGYEIRKSRPCTVISPDEMNRHLQTVIIAPMTTQTRAYPSRVNVTFQSKKGQIVLDQIRTVDRSRLTKRLGRLTSTQGATVLDRLGEIFAP